MGLPFFSLRSKEKKKKKKESKVSPRPSISDGQVKEKELWKKSSSDYKESDDSAASSMISNGSIKSSTSSSSNGSIRSRSRRMRSNSIIIRYLLVVQILPGDISWREKGGGLCWPMFRRPKIQTKK
ncbi:hypothetical protein A2U01_0015468 [Trifolium medium]|uniref:Uncharacterized protein n=1 Tax=Trifolium medium TaxID=97028 RepID=A0A392N3V9_9FABA|nr:hypothetical protein [Trifolium medium]